MTGARDKGTTVADVEGSKSSPRPFDVQTIRFLVRLMSHHNLNEIDLSEGEQRIRLRRGLPGRVGILPAAAEALAPTPSPAPPPEATESAPAPTRPLLEIKSPLVGTFYARPKPEADPYVQVGSRVNSDTVVCLIEAMKIYNDIKAECSGVIVEILVDNAEPVEYGTVLFRVDPGA